MEPENQKKWTTIGWCVVVVLLLVTLGQLWFGGKKKTVRIPEGYWAKVNSFLAKVAPELAEQKA